MATTLIVLPADLLALIISYVRAPPDLRNVSLTCKALYAVAVVPIYRTMTLRLSWLEADNRQLLQALVPENAALLCVRHIVIDRFSHCYEKNTEKLLMTLQLLANLLPRDILISLTLDSLISYEARTLLISSVSSILEILYRRQRQLRTMRVDSYASAWQVRRYANLANVTTLQFEISSTATAETCGSVLQHTPYLRNLEIRGHLEKYDSGSSKDQMSAHLVGRVFGSLLKKDRRIVLRALQVRGLDLSLASAKLASAIDLSQIDSLGLHMCSNMVDFLGQMTPIGTLLRPSLRTLVLIDRPDSLGSGSVGNDSSGVAAVDNLLGSFIGLENLVVAAPDQRALMPGFKALGNHVATLRLLYIDCLPLPSSANDANVVTASNLHLLLRQCIQLEQIALEMPQLLLTYHEDEIERTLEQFAVALAAAPRLRTFQPNNKLKDRLDIEDDLDANEVTYAGIDSVLQHWATDLMSLIPKLTAVGLAFRSAELRGIWVNPHYYVRGNLSDPYGRKSTAALQVTLKQLREIEPVSEILDINPYGPGLLRLGYQP
ncbi:hypothetical protein KC318_g9114 [Hortaea werneckii]|nr:hypothetical protein KC334_g9622 [Hortaea werneckii]KAI6970029.1 hypothetical protein KC355_g11869 [Hortaea werneckii]KAI7662012.1 hypothetical protein KC318_g9114 [Hortaea werneckii]